MFVTFKLSGFQKFLPLGADLIHTCSHLTGGIVFPINQLLARFLQCVNAALVGRELCLKGLDRKSVV